MFLFPYHVASSGIAGAGQGIFLDHAVPAGRIIVVPDGIRPAQIYSLEQLNQFPADSLEQDSSVRWFENQYTTNLEWTDECYINHSFSPTGIWHLGFIFAARELQPGEELTIDYRFIIPEGEQLPFLDSATGQPIIGYSWQEIIQRSAQEVLRVVR